MATHNVGRILPIFKGNYDNTLTYEKLDIVYYKGSSYVAKETVKGVAPTNATKWQAVAIGSDQIVTKISQLENDSGYLIARDFNTLNGQSLINPNETPVDIPVLTPADITSDLTSTSKNKILSAFAGNKLNGQLVAVDGKTKENEKNVTNLTEKVSKTELTVTDLNGKVTTAEGNITKLSDELKVVDGNVKTVESNITTLTTDLGTVDSKISTAEQNITTIDGKVTTAEGNITKVSNELKVVDGNVKTVESNVTTLTSNVQAIDEKVVKIEDQISSGSIGGANKEVKFVSTTNSQGKSSYPNFESKSNSIDFGASPIFYFGDKLTDLSKVITDGSYRSVELSVIKDGKYSLIFNLKENRFFCKEISDLTTDEYMIGTYNVVKNNVTDIYFDFPFLTNNEYQQLENWEFTLKDGTIQNRQVFIYK